MTIWFTSDTHFNHAAIVGMAGRPFADVKTMDEHLIEAWNAVVRPRDTVWHLGDFSLGSPGTAVKYFRRLNGSKHLVVGNHDGKDVKSCSWASVHDIASQRIDGVKLTLCHYPLLSWRGSAHNRDGVVNSISVHGHVHGTPSNPHLPHLDPCRVDVGVDMRGMAPVNGERLVAEVRAAFAEAPPRPRRTESADDGPFDEAAADGPALGPR